MHQYLKLMILASLLLSLSISSKADPVLITHPDTNIDAINQKDLQNLWLGYRKTINGTQLDIIDLDEEHQTRFQFYLEFIGYTDNQLKAHWAKRVFRGEGFPPKMVASEEEVIKWVSGKSNRLGYIEDSNEDDRIKYISLEN